MHALLYGLKRLWELGICAENSDNRCFCSLNGIHYPHRGENMNHMTAQEAAERWEISRRRVQILCAEDRVPGALKVANLWLIPKEAQKPKDLRKDESGR